MRSPTARAKITESGKTGPAKPNPTNKEKATAAAGAMCVIDWNNTCAKPMECSLRWSNLCSVSTSDLLTRPSGVTTLNDTRNYWSNATRNAPSGESAAAGQRDLCLGAGQGRADARGPGRRGARRARYLRPVRVDGLALGS